MISSHELLLTDELNHSKYHDNGWSNTGVSLYTSAVEVEIRVTCLSMVKNVHIEFVRLESDLVNNQLLILVNKGFGNKSIEKFEYY